MFFNYTDSNNKSIFEQLTTFDTSSRYIYPNKNKL